MGFFSDNFGGFLGLAGGALGAVGSLIGGRESQKNAANINYQNYLAQKEFAQNSIQWRVEDAKKAGLHPLFALGGGGASYSPSSQVGDSGVSQAFGRLGQSLSNFQLREERELTEQQKQSNELDLDYKRLRNAQMKQQLDGLKDEVALSKLGQSVGGAALVEGASLNTPKKVKAFNSQNSNDSLQSVAKNYGVTLERDPLGNYAVYPDPDSTSGQAYSEGIAPKVSWKLRSFEFVPKIVADLNEKAGKQLWDYKFNPFIMSYEITKKKNDEPLRQHPWALKHAPIDKPDKRWKRTKPYKFYDGWL